MRLLEFIYSNALGIVPITQKLQIRIQLILLVILNHITSFITRSLWINHSKWSNVFGYYISNIHLIVWDSVNFLWLLISQLSINVKVIFGFTKQSILVSNSLQKKKNKDQQKIKHLIWQVAKYPKEGQTCCLASGQLTEYITNSKSTIGTSIFGN